MSPVANSVLGIAFLGLAVAATFLMYRLWGYPFDKEKLRSTAPAVWLLVHRLMGWAFVAVYLYFMSQMLPRLWGYQIEFPARTVAHLTLGMAIGAMLVAKIVIVRFFKHLESELAPMLGTGLFIAAVMLIGLSAPFALKETYLQAGTIQLMDPNSLGRISERLETAGLSDEDRRAQLASYEGLEGGRAVLFGPCVECHDLRTVLARPRTPEAWRSTVTRMADRAMLISPISEDDQWAVTAYLIAISPDLQRSVAEQREQELTEQRSRDAVQQAIEAAPEAEQPPYDPAQAQALVEQLCAQCHPLELLEAAPPGSIGDARQLVDRMVDNGLVVDAEQVRLMVRYLSERGGPM